MKTLDLQDLPDPCWREMGWQAAGRDRSLQVPDGGEEALPEGVHTEPTPADALIPRRDPQVAVSIPIPSPSPLLYTSQVYKLSGIAHGKSIEQDQETSRDTSVATHRRGVATSGLIQSLSGIPKNFSPAPFYR